MQEIKVKPGYKMTELGVIPEDWEVKQLSEISDCLDSYRVPLNEIQRNKMKGNIPYCGANGVVGYVNDYVIDDDIILMAEDGGYFDEYKTRPIAYRMVGKCWVNNHAHILKSKNTTNQNFLFYSLVNKNILNYINGGTRAKLNKGELYKIQIPIPKNINEQKSIAQVLSDTDNLINSLNKLIEKKEKIKEGAMQELLTGKRRLPGFDGEWGEKKLGDVCEIKKGQLITSETCIKGNIPVIAGGKQPAYYHNQANRKANTITVSASGANAGYVNFHKYPIFASDCSTIEESKNYSIYFIYNYLQLLQNKIYKSQTGGAQPHIHPSDLNPLEINIPKDINEQKAIAEVLSDMDSEIETLKIKRDKYKQIKEGMMQNLLTGKIRLV